MENPIKILHLEDNPTDALMVEMVLKRSNLRFEYQCVDNEKDFLLALKNQDIHLVLSDYHLPDYSGSDALHVVKNEYPQIPFVFLSGTMGEDAAIESLLNGATDYVLKNKIERLVPAVSRAFREARHKAARQTAERELKKLSRAVEQSPNSIMITDTDGLIEYVNPVTLKITGYSFDELIGQNPRILKSGMQSSTVYEQMWETIRSGKEWRGEFHNRKKNGQLFWESVNIAPILNDQGDITNFLAVKQDVTESKQLTAELIRSKEKAEESDRLKTAFLHNISHEIRTPMNAIIGFSEFLVDPDLATENKKQYTDIIIQSSKQLLSIISDIVNIATIEAGQEKVYESEFKLNTTLDFIYEQFQIGAREKDVALKLVKSLSDQQDWIVSDDTKISQVLGNLIGNALKFTSKGVIEFGYVLKSDILEFYVSDTGIGIHPDMHQEIFNRFSQVESTVDRQYGGSGLGLSISKAYVELMGGEMWIESELDKGATFYFTLPFKPAKK